MIHLLMTFLRGMKKLCSQWQLIFEMARQEISDRYAGQALGAMWVVIHPLVVIGVYIFIFSFVFKAKIGRDTPGDYSYITYLLAGLIPWLTCQEIITKASTTIIKNSALVKQIIFPIEILPIQGVLSSFVTQLICFAIFFIYLLFTGTGLNWLFILLPVLWLMQILIMSGICYLLSAAGVFLRDLREVIQVFTFVGMYAMPLFYLPEWLPKAARPIIYFNPFSYMLWCYRDIMCDGSFVHPFAWIVFFVGSVIVFFIGFIVFEHLKHMFGDAL